MKMIIGKKIEMSQRFKEDGTVIPVTLILAPPVNIVQIKTKDKDGYSAVQLGAFPKKKLNKAAKGHLKDLLNYGVLKEFGSEKGDGLEKGKELTVEQFNAGDIVSITGTSKGRGFQGVVKRHGFHGSPASHGHKDQLRMPGSIGATGIAKVFKGQKMPGQMGNKGVTVKNLKIVEVDKEKNVIAVKGAIPGARNSLVYVISK